MELIEKLDGKMTKMEADVVDIKANIKAVSDNIKVLRKSVDSMLAKIKRWQEESKNEDSLLKLYDLYKLYRFYKIEGKLWVRMSDEFDDMQSRLYYKEISSEYFQNFKNHWERELNGIDMEEFITCCRKYCGYYANLRTIYSQDNFIEECRDFDFSDKYKSSAGFLIRELEGVEKRMLG